MSHVSGSDLTPPDSGTKLTYDDLANMPDDGLRRELIDGELHVTPSPSIRHQTIVLNLASLILGHVRRHALGRVFVAPLDVLFSQIDVVEPDVLFVGRPRERSKTATCSALPCCQAWNCRCRTSSKIEPGGSEDPPLRRGQTAGVNTRPT